MSETEQPPDTFMTYTAKDYGERSITIAAGLAAVMSAHESATQHEKDCALAWFASRYINKPRPTP